MVPIRVLVVDDSVTIRAILEELLAREKDILLVGVAGDGDEAMEMVTRLRPTVVTVDVDMPGLDGIGLLGQIVATTSAHAVMLSSHVEVKRRVTEMGAMGFFDKGRMLRDTGGLIRMIRAAAKGKLDPALAALKAEMNKTEAPAEPQQAAVEA
jgi:chemotaxis response regulator CheB